MGKIALRRLFPTYFALAPKRLATPALDHGSSSPLNIFSIKTYFPNFLFFVVVKQFGSIELEN
jgi:hypothetical protein